MPPATKEQATSLSAIADKRDRRFPRVIDREEIDSLPLLEFAKGCASSVFLSRERDDARYIAHGYCFHAADMDEFVWDQSSWDETYFCIKGVLKLGVRDKDGNETELVMNEGEHGYLPAGYTYILRPSGVESINFWTLGPVLNVGLVPLKDIGMPDAPEYSKQLRALRDA
jgi:hypothetical protein